MCIVYISRIFRVPLHFSLNSTIQTYIVHMDMHCALCRQAGETICAHTRNTQLLKISYCTAIDNVLTCMMSATVEYTCTHAHLHATHAQPRDGQLQTWRVVSSCYAIPINYYIVCLLVTVRALLSLSQANIQETDESKQYSLFLIKFVQKFIVILQFNCQLTEIDQFYRYFIRSTSIHRASLRLYTKNKTKTTPISTH